MPCVTKGACSYSTTSKVRFVYLVQSTGPRQCATNVTERIDLSYISPGVWSHDDADGSSWKAETEGGPGGWTWTRTVPAGGGGTGNGCADLPVSQQQTVQLDNCSGYRFQAKDTYADGSQVTVQVIITVYDNAGC